MKEITLGLVFIGLILPCAILIWKLLIDELKGKNK
jgi:hypothetical protein